MKNNTRSRVAAILIAANRRKNVGSVYDYSASRYRMASARVDGGRVTGFDYDTGTHFSGGGSKQSLDFYDYETSGHVQLRFDGRNFTGYDYHTGSHFSGSISGNSVSLYDYGTGRYYSFS